MSQLYCWLLLIWGKKFGVSSWIVSSWLLIIWFLFSPFSCACRSFFGEFVGCYRCALSFSCVVGVFRTSFSLRLRVLSGLSRKNKFDR